MKKKIALKIILPILLFSFLSCKDNTVGPAGINPDIVKIKSAISDNEIMGGNYVISIFTGHNNIFSLAPPRVIALNNNYSFQKDTVLFNLIKDGSFRYTFVNKSNFSSKILLVFSQFANVSCGSLFEYDLQNSDLVLLRDSSYNISSSVYYKTKPNECIYYTYGNPAKNLQAGYYSLNTKTLEEKLLLPYLSGLGGYANAEYSNGFDISPDDNKMIFPIHNASQPAHAAFFDLRTQIIDTLKFNFQEQFVWLRYSHSGKQLLYNNYPYGIANYNANGISDMGIINLSDLFSKHLDVSTRAGWNSISMCPDWSEDDKNILFGSGPGPASEPPGAIGLFSVYLLKNIQ